MNITISTSIFPPDIGGPATYAQEILKRLTIKGYRINVVTPSEKAQESDLVSVMPKRYPKLRVVGFVYFHLILFWGILKAARKSDIIYTLNPAFIGLVSLIAARFLGKPIILRFVGDTAWESTYDNNQTTKNLEEFLRSPNGEKHIRRLIAIQKFVLNHVDKVIVPSNFLKDILMRYYDVDPTKLRIINNAVDFELCSQSKYKNFQLPGTPCIITVGRLIRHKKIRGIIRALKDLSDEYPDIGLLIVGEGPEESNLERFSKEMEVNNRIEFYGRASHEDTMKLLHEADIFVLNSIYEGLPHVVIEAMACGIPVIATDIRGTDEVVKDSKTGLLIQSNNVEDLKCKMIWLLENENLRKTLVKNAYMRVKMEFTWDKLLDFLEKELEEVI